MGNAVSSTSTAQSGVAAGIDQKKPSPVPSGGANGGSSCPVPEHQRGSFFSSKASDATNEQRQDSSASASTSSSCPIPESQRSKSRVSYNVYNQKMEPPKEDSNSGLKAILGYENIDPRNQMPRDLAQQPGPGQKKLISTERLVSNIPKGGTDSTWVYPSPQQFYNALKRKNKAEDVTEDVMEHVVHAHNTMNEVTWQRVLDWERLHREECGHPALLRFRGRPDDLSPLARLKSWGGKALPFDRHDWWVDRCGKEVRYVIDFYFVEEKAGTPEAFEVTARPALDSPSAALDRVKMAIYTSFAAMGLPCPIKGMQGALKSPEASEAPEK